MQDKKTKSPVESFIIFLILSSYASVMAQRPPTLSPSTLTIPVMIQPSNAGGSISEHSITITLNPSPPAGPAFTAGAGEPPVPGDSPPCASFNAFVFSCASDPVFYGLPLSAQAQCLCNIGPWDEVATACFDEFTVLGQYYASSITSHVSTAVPQPSLERP
jgi:hypothetical protein